MRLYTNEKEAQVIQIALAHLVAKDGAESETAQALLTRISQCLELQGIEKKANKMAKSSD